MSTFTVGRVTVTPVTATAYVVTTPEAELCFTTRDVRITSTGPDYAL